MRVPHQVKNRLRPTVSKTRETAPTATVSRGLFSANSWLTNYNIRKEVSKVAEFEGPYVEVKQRWKHTLGAELAKKTSVPR